MSGELEPESLIIDASKRASSLESIGIWAQYRFIKMLEGLNQPAEAESQVVAHLESPVYHPGRVRRYRKFNSNKLIGATFGVALVLASAAMLSTRIYLNLNISPEVSISKTPAPTLPIPARIDLTDKDTSEKIIQIDGIGYSAPFGFGVITSNVDYLSLQIYPARLNTVIKESGLGLPEGRVILTHIMSERIQTTEELQKAKQIVDTDMRNFQFVQQFINEQGREPTRVDQIAASFFNAEEAAKRSTNFSFEDSLNLELSKEWLRGVKRIWKGEDSELSASEIEILALEKPLRVVKSIVESRPQ